MNAKHPPMTLGNLRDLGTHRLLVSCLNPDCRHTALIDVSNYSDDMEVPSFGRRAVCGHCGGKRADVRPNWKEQPTQPPTATRYDRARRLIRRAIGLLVRR